VRGILARYSLVATFYRAPHCPPSTIGERPASPIDPQEMEVAEQVRMAQPSPQHLLNVGQEKTDLLTMLHETSSGYSRCCETRTLSESPILNMIFEPRRTLRSMSLRGRVSRFWQVRPNSVQLQHWISQSHLSIVCGGTKTSCPRLIISDYPGTLCPL
jgi:hypothetical protein